MEIFWYKKLGRLRKIGWGPGGYTEVKKKHSRKLDAHLLLSAKML